MPRKAGSSRQFWFDRNASVDLNMTYEAGSVGPHAATTRWSKTVAANKKLIMTSSVVSVLRQTVAGVIGLYSTNISPGPNIRTVIIYSLENTIGAYRDMVVGNTVIAPAGTVLTGTTEDQSTGGTVQYICVASGQEFDAN